MVRGASACALVGKTVITGKHFRIKIGKITSVI
jgi:hypothetical protein